MVHSSPENKRQKQEKKRYLIQQLSSNVSRIVKTSLAINRPTSCGRNFLVRAPTELCTLIVDYEQFNDTTLTGNFATSNAKTAPKRIPFTMDNLLFLTL